jgi:hypothetical protein
MYDYQRTSETTSSRVIYLGTIRRRRSTHFDRRRFTALLLAGMLSLTIWLIVVITIVPARLPSYLAFFLPLWLGLTTISAALYYRVQARNPSFGVQLFAVSVRRGALIASVIVFNLVLLAVRHWDPLVAVIVIAVVVIAEVVMIRLRSST